MNQEFNDRAYSREVYYDALGVLRINRVLELVGQGKQVLDLGCGDGTIASHIQRRGNEVTGLEISDVAIGFAKQKIKDVYKVDLTGNWLESTPALRDKKFDIVVASELLEHIFDTDKLLENVKSVLKPSGSLIITTPNVASLGRRILLLLGISPHLETTARVYDAGHVRYFTFATLKKLLEEHGFKIDSIKSTPVNFDPKGVLMSSFLSEIIPTLGSCIILKASL